MNLDEVINKIEDDLNIDSSKTNFDLIYAFNGTGKTRISRILLEKHGSKCLCFNALFQDNFIWDNENYTLILNWDSWIVRIINEQGLQNEIIKNFQKTYGEDILPKFNSISTQVTFDIKTIDGYDKNIKISKAEETLFIWSVFYTILEFAISELKEKKENRSTNIFDDLNWIIIDDPVSSIDDTKITGLAIEIYNIINEYKEPKGDCDINFHFLITTHHALFYNLLYNLTHREKNIRDRTYILQKKNYEYTLSEKGDNAFGYHLILKNKISEAINSDSIEKIHFNMFRILLEKTANYFGYKKYDECLIESPYKQEIIKLINLYSHGSLPEFEFFELTDKEIEIFKQSFKDFMDYYKMEVKDE